jgi:hypothetical protein
MKQFKHLLLIFVLSIFVSCSDDFYQRRYLPGVFLNTHGKTDGLNCVAETQAINAEPVYIDSELKVVPMNDQVQEKEEFHPNVSMEMSKKQNSKSVCSPPLVIWPTDTIPPLQPATQKELRTAQLIATGCLAVMVGSWFFLPVIGIVGVFLIHFVLGAIGLLAVAYCAENKNKFMNGLGVMVGIAMAAFVLFAIFRFINCTFIENCQT